MAGSSWSACPREILVQCFTTQADNLDNVSANATCKAWHDALLAAAELITAMSVCDGPLSNQTRLLHNFPNLQTVKIVMAAVASKGSDFHTDSPNNGQHSQQQAVWLPISCTCLIMEDFSNAGSSENLSNLQEVHIQAARMPLMSFASLGSLQNLLALTIAGGREPGQNALITGSIVNLPKGLTLPAAPSPAGLQCLKQTVRLKHVAIAKREGRSLACLLQCCVFNPKLCSCSCI